MSYQARWPKPTPSAPLLAGGNRLGWWVSKVPRRPDNVLKGQLWKEDPRLNWSALVSGGTLPILRRSRLLREVRGDRGRGAVTLTYFPLTPNRTSSHFAKACFLSQ
jgi:hypothetical protein